MCILNYTPVSCYVCNAEKELRIVQEIEHFPESSINCIFSTKKHQIWHIDFNFINSCLYTSPIPHSKIQITLHLILLPNPSYSSSPLPLSIFFIYHLYPYHFLLTSISVRYEVPLTVKTEYPAVDRASTRDVKGCWEWVTASWDVRRAV